MSASLSVLSMTDNMNLFTFNKIVPPLYVCVYICPSGSQIVSGSTALFKAFERLTEDCPIN